MESLAPPKSLVDQAYEVILDALCNGTFKPGERLTQEAIAERLNVSRQPVTHALAVLKAQGFLEASGRQGLTVTAADPDFFRSIYQLRWAVEPLAIRLAAARLTPAAIKAGRSILKRGRAMVAAGDRAAVLQADMDFHLFLYELSGNSLIADTMRLHWRHLRRAMGQVLSQPGMSVSAWEEHEQILEAMIAGDAAAAADQARRHLADAYVRVSGDAALIGPEG